MAKTSGNIPDDWLKRLSTNHDLSFELLAEYLHLFQEHGVPVLRRRRKTKDAKRIVAISTHGYWSDPPPAGVPDTGGQTYYVLEVAKAWARQGRKVIILARWFEPYPRVETIARNLWLVRIRAGGDEFIRKEDIYPLVPEMAEAATAVSLLFGAQAVTGHYADGMAGAAEVSEQLKIPSTVIPHSMGILKVINLGYDPDNPESWFDPEYNFWIRESLEIASLKGANLEIANTPEEPNILKAHYGLEFPNIVMPAGAGEAFFNADKQDGNKELPGRFGLVSGRYLIFYGRFSRAKNIPGVVAVLGEARRLDPELFRDVNLVIVGGDPGKPRGEEQEVEDQILETTGYYNLTRSDVIRIPSLGWKELSPLVGSSLFYTGMQMLEPFGMSVAEAMAARTPVLISRNAGISKWLTDGKHALIVDPEDPSRAAARLRDAVKDSRFLEDLADNGRKLAEENFSWTGIARQQGELLDNLHRGEAPALVNNGEGFDEVFLKREGRAYHRLAFVWRGDPPVVSAKHKKAAKGLIPHIINANVKTKQEGRRVILALGGESGAGKSEVAEYLRFALKGTGIETLTLPGDAFFFLTPADNHLARIKAYERSRLAEYLGPGEIDFDRLESAVHLAADRGINEITVPSDCRRLESRRYEHVPMDLTGSDVIIVDLTYSLLLEDADIKAFFQSDFKKRLTEIRERNIARDPDQDFSFIEKVLTIEHEIIQGMKKDANLIITDDYEVVTNG
ncbi:MAG: glycosyltransferase [bacterium]